MPFDTQLADNASPGIAAPQQDTSLADALRALAAKGIYSPDQVPDVSFTDQPTPFLGGSVENLPGYVPPDSGRALPAWQVEDRSQYWAAQQQIAEAQRTQDALQAQQAFEQRRAAANANAVALGGQFINQLTHGAVGVVQQYNKTGAEITALQNVNVADYGYDPQRADTWQPALDRANEEALRRSQAGVPNVRVISPQEAGVGPTDALKGLGRLATTEIPGAQRVANVAGQVGEFAGQQAANAVLGPAASQAQQFLPDALQPQNIAGAVVGKAAELLVPTEVWQAALELVPGIGSVPELARAVRGGAPEAIAALTRAGEKLGAREDVQKFIGKLAEEAGASKIPGKAAEQAAPEIAGKSVEDVRNELVARRQQITAAIKVLPKAQQADITLGGLPEVFKYAARYERGSAERAALSEAASGYAAHLPEPEQKLVKGIIDNLSSNAEVKVATRSQRSQQAGRALQAYENTAGTETEKATAAFKAMSGKQAQRFEPVGTEFTTDEVAHLEGKIAQAAGAKAISVFERPQAASALNLLLTGQRLPGVASEATKPLNLMPYERKLLGRIFGPEIEAVLPKTPGQLRSVTNWLNLPRALVTAIDFSAAGRQGILLAARNPVEWAKSFPVMARAMRSEEGFQKAAQQLLDNPKFTDGLIHGLDITDIGGGLGAEEPYISGLAEKIPGVRASERGYVMFLNNLRMLTYEKYTNRIEKLADKQGWDLARTDLVKSNMARFINHATGRGTLPTAMKEYAPALNAVFFSPRFFLSRPQSVWDLVRPGTDKFSRQVAFENLGAFVGAGTGALYLAHALGADVEIDPRSADFGRMRIGPTRIDFWGGYQPLARYIAQAATLHSKNTSTGEVKFADPSDTAMRFFRSKLSPPGALVYDLIPGKRKDYSGNDILIDPRDLGFDKASGEYAWKAFGQRIFPLAIQDAINAYQTQGWGGALTAGAVSAAGGGVSSYNPTEAQQETIGKNQVDDALKKAGVPDPVVAYKQPNWQALFRQEMGVDVSKYGSLDDLKAAFVDEYAPKLAAQNKLPLKQAKIDAGQAFEKYTSVKQFRAAESAAKLAFWKAHPDLLRRALDAGTETLNASERKILGLK